MGSTSYETENFLATFSLRGKRIRECGRDVARYVFLVGMASVVVLGSLLVLSTPSFAQLLDRLKIAAIDDVVAGDEGWIIAIDDVAADAGGWITAMDDVVAGSGGGIAAYAAEAGGGFAAFGDIAAEAGSGIAAFGKVEEEIAKLAAEVDNKIGSLVAGAGSSSVGANNPAEKSGDNKGGDAVADIIITKLGDEVQLADESEDEDAPIGDAIITTAAAHTYDKERERCWIVTIPYHSRWCVLSQRATSAVDISGNISGENTGVYVSRSSDGHADLVNNADIDNVFYGIKFIREGEGELDIINNGKITDVEKNSIYARHIGNGLLRIRSKNEIVSLGDGIYAQHDGENGVIIHIDGKVVSEESSGVFVEHNGEGDIRAHVNGEVRGGDGGISAVHNGEGRVDIWVRPGAEVHGNSVGIQASTDRETGKHITIDVAGKVSSSEGNAINIGNDRSFDTLVLRPEFELDGTAVSNGHGRLSLSYRTSSLDDLLKLGAVIISDSVYDTSRVPPGILDLSADEFHGFREFSKDSWQRWILTGEASEDEVFSRADVGGWLRLSDVDFRMEEHSRGFEDFNVGGILEIAGSNRLRGNMRLGTRGRLVFAPKDKPEDEDASLTISGNFSGFATSNVIFFNVDLARQSAGKLTILGDVEGYSHRRRRVLMNAPNDLDSAKESPVLVEVHGYAQAGDFKGAETIGAFDYVLEHKVVGGDALPAPLDEILDDMIEDLRERHNELEDDLYDHYDRLINDLRADYWEAFRDDSSTEDEIEAISEKLAEAQEAEDKAFEEADKAFEKAVSDITSGENFGFHTWRFRRDGVSKFAEGVSSEAGDVARDAGADIDVDGQYLPNQNNLKFSSVHDNHFQLGFDIPVMNFMGGDLVVGTGLMQGLSTSSIDEITGISSSIELGYGFDAMGLRFSPQIQLVWSSVDFDSFVGPHGELVSLEDGDIVMGRLSLSWDGEWRNSHVYGGINLHTVLDGRTVVNVSGVSIASEQENLSADGRLGASYKWGEGLEIYGEAVASYRDDLEEVHASLGMQIDF